jgi:hypothetical protein
MRTIDQFFTINHGIGNWIFFVNIASLDEMIVRGLMEGVVGIFTPCSID